MMATIALTRILFLHALRSRLVFLVMVFSVLSQVAGIKIFHDWLAVAIGFSSDIRMSHSVFVCLFLQLFGGLLLSVAYGVWIAPYLHSGLQAQLTLVLPVPRVFFAIAHACNLLGLLAVQYSAMMAVFIPSVGMEALHEFPVGLFLLGVLMECACFTSLMFVFAIISLGFGPVVSLFGGMMALSVLQFLGIVKAMRGYLLTKGLSFGDSDWLALYNLLPPAGDLVFHLRNLSEAVLWIPITKWIAWLAILVALYILSIGSCRRIRHAE